MQFSLRPWRSDDAWSLFRAVDESPDLATQFRGACIDDVESAAAFIDRELTTTASRQHWAICLDDVACGDIGVSHIEFTHESAWISYWLAPVARGKGLAARGLATVAAWAYAEAGLFRLELGHHVNNPASCRVATRAGFSVEGVERQKLRYGDERFDVETHSRLRTDEAPSIEPLPLVTSLA